MLSLFKKDLILDTSTKYTQEPYFRGQIPDWPMREEKILKAEDMHGVVYIYKMPKLDNIQEVLSSQKDFFVLFCSQLAQSAPPSPNSKKFYVIKREITVGISGRFFQVEFIKKTTELWRNVFSELYQNKQDAEIVIVKKKGFFFFKQKEEVIDLREENAEAGCPDYIFTKGMRKGLCNIIEIMGASYNKIKSKHSVLLFAHEKKAVSQVYRSIQITWNLVLPAD